MARGKRRNRWKSVRKAIDTELGENESKRNTFFGVRPASCSCPGSRQAQRRRRRRRRRSAARSLGAFFCLSLLKVNFAFVQIEF